MQFLEFFQTIPTLSIIVFLPATAGLLLMLIPSNKVKTIYNGALVVSLITFLLTLAVYFGFDVEAANTANAAHEVLYQFEEQYNWLPALGISYHIGVDGISAPLVMLTGIVMFTGVIISQRIEERKREFFAFLFILATGVFGVFVSLDMFVLFFFYEIAVFPMDERVRCHEADPLSGHWVSGCPGRCAGDVFPGRVGHFRYARPGNSWVPS